jgi:hypothetical protein
MFSKIKNHMGRQFTIGLGLLLVGALSYSCTPLEKPSSQANNHHASLQSDTARTSLQNGVVQSRYTGLYKGVFSSNRAISKSTNNRRDSLIFYVDKKNRVKAKIIIGGKTIGGSGRIFVDSTGARIVFGNSGKMIAFKGRLVPVNGTVVAKGKWGYCPPCVYMEPSCKIACRDGGGVWKAKKQRKISKGAL